MSDIAIKIEGLGKRYRYGGAAPLSANLRADLTDWLRGIFSPRRNTEVHGVNVTSAPPAPSAVKRSEPQGSQRFTEETPSAASAVKDSLSSSASTAASAVNSG